ncbi:hypothetical protein F1B92_04050 [Campylobacter sp. FMV-PI01]|uniref:Prokaryotic metallothionein family protein n=1 Tax=Campylobacter portucalensis TaxID=2608384 RepID=A0A6L5WK24_9BACT|nr:hypothetical protein [Campylobacter portucalensis]MSN96365.1 hypothetical protein [Campylobacter portucalensis]
MGKILILILICAFCYFLILPKFRTKKDNKIQNFVECDKCNTFVDIKEAIIKNQKYICKDCLKRDR